MRKKITIILIAGVILLPCCPLLCLAQEETPQGSQVVPPPAFDPGIPIQIYEPSRPLEERLDRKISLDVRDMNIIDVIKFLATRGEFNIVTNPTIMGRVTLHLKSVSIRDALDIVLASNNLAYSVKKGIFHIMTDGEYAALYGKSFNNKTEVSIVNLQYAKPSYALAALDNMKTNVGKIIIDEDTGSVVLIDTVESIARMQDALYKMDTPLEVFVYNLQYAKADVVAEKLRVRIDANAVGSITADERSNQLIVRALPDRRREVEWLVGQLDSQTKEVLIEARVMQVTFRPQYDAGIDWDFDFRDSADPQIKKLTFSNVFLNEDNLTSGDNLYSRYAKMAAGSFGADAFEMSVRALKQISDTKILSNPKLLVTNNEEARIHIGDTVPYIISTTSGTGDNAITSEDVRFVDVGLQLKVTPTINDDGYVTMRLKPEISTVTTRIESQGGGIPQVNKTEVETTVMVKDGNTIILGGLKKDEKTNVKKGLPFLMDIPFLGIFFGSKSDVITKTEIIIFITPHIVKGEDDYKEWRGKIKPFKTYEDAASDIKKMRQYPKAPGVDPGLKPFTEPPEDMQEDSKTGANGQE